MDGRRDASLRMSVRPFVSCMEFDTKAVERQWVSL